MKQLNFLFIPFALLLTSCAIHSGMMTGNASISSNNFTLSHQVYGYAKATRVLGIGGLDGKGLVMKAKQDLYSNSDLKQGQALGNVSVDFKRSFFILVAIEEVFITADVYDFNSSSQTKNNSKSPDTLKKSSNEIKLPDTLKKSSNETSPYQKVNIVEEDDNKKYNRKVKLFNGYTLDQMVKIPNETETAVITGRIMELGKSGAIIRFTNGNGQFTSKFFNYSQIKRITLD